MWWCVLYLLAQKEKRTFPSSPEKWGGGDCFIIVHNVKVISRKLMIVKTGLHYEHKVPCAISHTAIGCITTWLAVDLTPLS